jgi:uncharacterized protein
MKRTVIVFAKQARMGRVKTRLAKGLGHAGALAFYRRTLAATLRKTWSGAWRVILCVSPDNAARQTRLWPARSIRARATLASQGRGDLGQRMARALATQTGPTILIGCDIPEIGRDDLAAAFAALGTADLVFGPAVDGGYWLVGTRTGRFVPGLFKRVRWSSAHALADTIANTRRTVAYGRTIADIDTAADYWAWKTR